MSDCFRFESRKNVYFQDHNVRLSMEKFYISSNMKTKIRRTHLYSITIMFNPGVYKKVGQNMKVVYR